MANFGWGFSKMITILGISKWLQYYILWGGGSNQSITVLQFLGRGQSGDSSIKLYKIQFKATVVDQLAQKI